MTQGNRDQGQNDSGHERELDPNERAHDIGAKIVSNLLIIAVIVNIVALGHAVAAGDAQTPLSESIRTAIEWTLKATLALSASGLVLLAGALIRPGVINIPWTATLTGAALLSGAGIWIW